jgi:hypothetical protein
LCKENVTKFSAAAKNDTFLFKLAVTLKKFSEFLTCWQIVIPNFFGVKMAWALRGHHGLSNRERAE